MIIFVTLNFWHYLRKMKWVWYPTERGTLRLRLRVTRRRRCKVTRSMWMDPNSFNNLPAVCCSGWSFNYTQILQSSQSHHSHSLYWGLLLFLSNPLIVVYVSPFGNVQVLWYWTTVQWHGSTSLSEEKVLTALWVIIKCAVLYVPKMRERQTSGSTRSLMFCYF